MLVIDEPTQGVDAKARLDIYGLISRMAEDGVGILINSSDSAELAGLCDRVYIMSDGMIIHEMSEDITESRIVQQFVSSTEKRGAVDERGGGALGRVARLLASPWMPMGVLLALIALVSAYAGVKSPLFFLDFNINNTLLSALPLIWLALGQQFALLVGEFDISVGATTTLSVVVASFFLSEANTAISLALIVMIGVAVGVGLFNALLTQVLNINALVATIGTLGIVSGLCILLRPEPAGSIADSVNQQLSQSFGFMPFGILVVAFLAILLDFWLFRSGSGLSARAVGLRKESSTRVGVGVTRYKAMAFVAAATGAVVAGLLLYGQVGVGSNNVGLGLALPAFAACFLGGATLSGGRGTFMGAALGALFLSVISNTTSVLNLPYAWTQVIYGGILVVAVSVYSVAYRKAD